MKKIILLALLSIVATKTSAMIPLGSIEENLISDAIIYIPVKVAKKLYKFVTTKENWVYTKDTISKWELEDAATLNFPTIPCLDNLTKQKKNS